MMVKVKICGITNARDAVWAARSGADAVGFILVPGTPRHLEPERVRAIVMELPPFVASVGVFLNEAPERVAEIMDFCGLHYAQLHGSETPRQCARLKGRRLIKAFRVGAEDDLRRLGRYQVDAYLLDAYVDGAPGGTGEVFDWRLARAARPYGHIIVAGGLRVQNVAKAILTARPYGVDVSSGVEEAPGKKSRDLVAAFIRIAKSVDV